jgi:hypothetical protein
VVYPPVRTARWQGERIGHYELLDTTDIKTGVTTDFRRWIVGAWVCLASHPRNQTGEPYVYPQCWVALPWGDEEASRGLFPATRGVGRRRADWRRTGLGSQRFRCISSMNVVQPQHYGLCQNLQTVMQTAPEKCVQKSPPAAIRVISKIERQEQIPNGCSRN